MRPRSTIGTTPQSNTTVRNAAAPATMPAAAPSTTSKISVHTPTTANARVQNPASANRWATDDEHAPRALAEQHPVQHHRRDEQAGGEHRQAHGDQVHRELLRNELAEARLEGHRQQQAREQLHPGLRDPQLLQEIVPVAVEALRRPFRPIGLVRISLHAEGYPIGGRRHRRRSSDMRLYLRFRLRHPAAPLTRSAPPGRLPRVHVGVADHFGWAVAVTVSDDHEVVDRRRIELVEPGVCAAPVHYEARNLDDDALAALVAEVRSSVARAASTALDDLAGALPAPVTTLSLRTWPAEFPTDIAVQRRTPYEARADAIMYRQVLAELAHDRGWRVHLYRAKDVLPQAADHLGDRAGEVLHGVRARLGPPWTQDHRTALAAAVLAS